MVGHDVRAPGFFWLAGQGGIGVQTAPIMARIAADLLLDGQSRDILEAIDLDSLSACRFL